MNIGLLLNFRMRGIPKITRRALGMLKRAVHSKQGVRSNDRSDERGPQPSLECPQNAMGSVVGARVQVGEEDVVHVVLRLAFFIGQLTKQFDHRG
jgi:hypothetical protein